jgi:hypothetical protein
MLQSKMGALEFIADVLSIITISLCLILKIPQIVNLLKLKSTVGINLYALLLELTRCDYGQIILHILL